MKIKNHKCRSCKEDDFAAIPSMTSVVGLYCTNCGKFLKWANKEEKNLIKIHKQEVTKCEQ